MILEPSSATEWAALLTVAISFVVAASAGVWAVFVRSQENARAEWRRVEELVQVVHHGSAKGLWAQKLAVDELLSLRKSRRYIIPILEEASQYFKSTAPTGSTLSQHIDQRLNEH